MKNSISLAVVLALVASVVAVSVYAWMSMGNVTMSTGGWVALILGIVFTMALGCGLMALVFVSARTGVDENVAGQRRVPDPQHHLQ